MHERVLGQERFLFSLLSRKAAAGACIPGPERTSLMKTEANIPYKFYLEESELPTAWYNVRADMKNKPAPLLNPGTLKPMTARELDGVFCDELVQQELDDTTA